MTQGNFWGWWKCSFSWLWYIYRYILRLVTLYSLNVCDFFFTSIIAQWYSKTKAHWETQYFRILGLRSFLDSIPGEEVFSLRRLTPRNLLLGKLCHRPYATYSSLWHSEKIWSCLLNAHSQILMLGELFIQKWGLLHYAKEVIHHCRKARTGSELGTMNLHWKRWCLCSCDQTGWIWSIMKHLHTPTKENIEVNYYLMRPMIFLDLLIKYRSCFFNSTTV